jgi:diketogulonate reductase-like aldo/keto reductase
MDVADAFVASADAGLDLFDTAEVYGDGESDKILGWLVRKPVGSSASRASSRSCLAATRARFRAHSTRAFGASG